jgi:molybdopterin-containing oxidoreductase family membrane subunit
MMATTTIRKETKRAAPPTNLIVSAILAVIGIAAWIYQLSAGMRVTGLGQQVVWGLYIAGFFTAVGTGAGLLALAGINEFLPESNPADRRRELSLALASFIVGGVLIVMDVGSPLQIWRIITAARFTSMMTWDFWLLAAGGLITLIYLAQARRVGAHRGMGVLAILAALAVVVVEGWMMAVLAARPMWTGGLTVFSFLLSAIIAGLGLGLLTLEGKTRLRGWLGMALGANLVLVLAEVLTGLLAGGDETLLLLTGSAAPAFWIHLVAGLILPLGLIIAGASLPLAGVLAVVGVLAEKVWMLAAGQAFPWLELPVGRYAPSWVEFVALIGTAGLGVFLYLIIEQVASAEKGSETV